MNSNPKAFMSYSHDSEEHKSWVLKLSQKLYSAGVNVILDQWDLLFGDDVAMFIESHMENSDRVLMVCTDQYVEKADSGTGGVGYERIIVTKELLENSQSNRFIPILRQHSVGNPLPIFLSTKMWANFTDDSKFDVETDKLINLLLGEPIPNRPPLGQISNRISSTIRKLDRAKLKKVKVIFIGEGGLVDFNIGYSKTHFNTLNRLIVDANKYEKLNILFDRKIPYIYEHGLFNPFSVPVGEFCGIYEFIFKYLSDDIFLQKAEYSEDLVNMINAASAEKIYEYIVKFKEVLEIFKKVMISRQNIIEPHNFPNGRYDAYTLEFVKDKLRKISTLFAIYYSE